MFFMFQPLDEISNLSYYFALKCLSLNYYQSRLSRITFVMSGNLVLIGWLQEHQICSFFQALGGCRV